MGYGVYVTRYMASCSRFVPIKFTHSIIIWIRVVLENKIIIQLVAKCPTFNGIQMFISSSQQSANAFRLEPDEYRPYVHMYLLNSSLALMTLSPKVISSMTSKFV
jgi:hypothetical protein